MNRLNKLKICVLLISIYLVSCTDSDPVNSEPNVSPTTGSVNILVNQCDFLLDPLCQNTIPLSSVNIFLFESVLNQDENKILQEGSTNNDGRIIFDNLEPETYYITASYQSEIIKDSLTITQNTSVSFLEILYLK